MKIDSPAKHYDIIVIGGGMVGSSFALAAAKALKSVSILVIDAHMLSDGDNTQPSFDDRSTALSFGSSQILSRIDLWEGIKDRAAKIETIHVSDKGHIGGSQLRHKDYGVEALGYVVENRTFGWAIQQRLNESACINYLSPASVKGLTPVQDGMTAVIAQGETTSSVTASLVVLADGGRSPLCTQLGITRDVDEYQQQALIANISFQRAHQNQAFERFTDTGPLAVLPLTSIENENRASLVWTISQEQVDEFSSLGQEQLITRLQERFGERLGDILKIGKISSYPLSLVKAKEQVRPGLVLLGNSAHTLHPVAGQGFNLALRDVQSLVASLALAKKEDQSLGDMAVLQHYLNGQLKDQQQAIFATDTLVKLFSNGSISKSLIRKFGLLSLELSPDLKQGFARRAMGLS